LKNTIEKTLAQNKDLLYENQLKTRENYEILRRNEEISEKLDFLNKSIEKRVVDSKMEEGQISLIIENLKEENLGFFLIKFIDKIF